MPYQFVSLVFFFLKCLRDLHQKYVFNILVCFSKQHFLKDNVIEFFVLGKTFVMSDEHINIVVFCLCIFKEVFYFIHFYPIIYNKHEIVKN